MIPDKEKALALHRKYGSSERVVKHCQAVAEASMILARRFAEKGKEVDQNAIFAGALLHDIGRSRTQTVDHGYVGARIIEEEGIDSKVVEIVRRHVGAGISPEEADKLGFPSGDYIPRSLEQRIVCFSDKLADSDKMRELQKEVDRFKAKGHDVPRLLALKKGIQDELAEDPETLVLSKINGVHTSPER